MKNIRILCGMLAVLSLPAFAQYNSDFNITGAGARAEGFGGAFIGLADDATAVVWNPSGLTQLERPEASIVTRYISEGMAFKNENRPLLNSEESARRFNLNFASLAIPFPQTGVKMVTAVSYQKQLDFYDRSKTEGEDQLGNPTVERSEGSGGVNTITPAIAMKLNPTISVGLSINIWTGSIENKFRSDIENRGRTEMDYSADYSGLNFVIGTLFDFEQAANGFPLKIGATVRTPFKLKSEGTLTIDDRVDNLQGTLDVKQTIEMPLMIGFGASYRVGDNLTFALDYELRNYAQKDLVTDLTAPGGGTISGTDRVSQSGKDLNEVRLGAEYLIVGETSVVPLRVGFKTVPTVLSDVDVTYDPSENSFVLTPNGVQVKGNGFSFGTGFISDAFAVDVTYGVQAYTQKFGAFSQLEYSIGTLSSSVIIYF